MGRSLHNALFNDNYFIENTSFCHYCQQEKPHELNIPVLKYFRGYNFAEILENELQSSKQLLSFIVDFQKFSWKWAVLIEKRPIWAWAVAISCLIFGQNLRLTTKQSSCLLKMCNHNLDRWSCNTQTTVSTELAVKFDFKNKEYNWRGLIVEIYMVKWVYWLIDVDLEK